MIHDCLFFPCPQSQIYSSCFGAECPVIDWVTECEIIHFTSYLNVSDFGLIVATERVGWNCWIVCACVPPRVSSLLSCYLSASREAGWGACERGSQWLCHPQSPDSVSAMCHTYTGTHCSRSLKQTSCWFNICPVTFTWREVMSQIVKVKRNRKCQRNHCRSLHTEERICCVMV